MNDTLMGRARALGLHGLAAHWGEVAGHDWPAALVAWEERLSCLSSELPWFLVPDDCVEDGQQFAHDGDEGAFLGLPSSTRRS